MQTIPALFLNSVARFGNHPMMLEHDGQCYHPLTYHNMAELVHSMAAGLISTGFRKGDRCILLSEGRNDWVMSELAVLCAGGINVPISVKIEEPSELLFRISHSEATMVIVSGRHSHKILQLTDAPGSLKHIVVLDPLETGDPRIITKEDLMSQGQRLRETNPGILESRMAEIAPDDAANICYTSGTTADPKGIILTHRNYVVNVDQAGQLFEIPAWYTSVLILPWDHSFAHTAGIYALMKNGASMASVRPGKTPLETLRNIPTNIRENKPHFLLSVPALAKNFKKNIEKGVESKGKFLKKLFDHGIKLSTALHGNGFNPTSVKHRWFKQLKYNLINAIIYKKVRGNFGGRLKFFVGGGALLDVQLQHFFYALGIPMYQGYGLTEAAPIISSNTPIRHKLGSSGYVAEGIELKICNTEGEALPAGSTGEIVIRGGNVMAGYWRNETATHEALKNGWLFTGDMGFMDHDGFLHVLGRFKSLLIGSDGEKYSPEGIEEALVEKSSLIDQIMIINNQHPYTSALVVINNTGCKALMTHEGWSGDEGVKKLLMAIQQQIDGFREGGTFADWFPQRWIPAAIAVLDTDFNESNHLINSTMKMVRGKISDHFADRIEYLYTTEGKELLNNRNIAAVMKYLNIQH
jgi:long-chain acyl-CoA synthetase